MAELQLAELQNLMKMYRDGAGYIKSEEDYSDYVKDLSDGERELFLRKAFLMAVVTRTSDYIKEIEDTHKVTEQRAYAVAVSLLMGALDIANLFEIELSERVMETLMEKFTSIEPE